MKHAPAVQMRVTVCALAAMMLASPALAQDVAAVPSPAAPIEISADKGLEWDRSAHTYTARGRAEAKQGDMKVVSDVLVARYDAAGSSSDIREVTAEGNVVLTSAPYTAYGDKAVYDLTSGVAVLTGDNLRVLTGVETLTAQDRLTYAAQDGRMTAEGGAVLTRPTDSIAAQTLTASFATSAEGTRALDTVTATGGVVIKTARENITGAKGVYHAARQQAELTGDVVITQGKNRLEGRRATVDMKTGVSKLYGSTSEGGRVKGVFYPKDQTEPAKPVQVAPVAVAEPVGEPVVDVVTPEVTQDITPVTPPATVVPDQEPVADIEKIENADEVPVTPPVDLPPEPFAVPAVNETTPTDSSTPVAVDKPDLNP